MGTWVPFWWSRGLGATFQVSEAAKPGYVRQILGQVSQFLGQVGAKLGQVGYNLGQVKASRFRFEVILRSFGSHFDDF